MGSIQAGFGKRKEIYNSLMRLKNAGKEIIVYSDRYDINKYDYYLISMADMIYSSSHTAVDLKGINATMTQHVKGVVKESIKIVKLKKKDSVLDIASNDGTLLNFYKKNIFRVGIDPLIKKYKNRYKNINFGIQDFFSYKAIQKKKNQ